MQKMFYVQSCELKIPELGDWKTRKKKYMNVIVWEIGKMRLIHLFCCSHFLHNWSVFTRSGSKKNTKLSLKSLLQ